jgi:hypothetical protein
MDDRIVARLVTPTLITVQLGALITVLSWVFYDWFAGVPALVISLILIARAVQTGFVPDREGLLMRPYLPFGAPGVIPWSRLQSVDVDEVIDGVESRNKKPRIRFMAEGEREPLQLIGCRTPTIDAVLEQFRSHGLPVTDQRGQTRPK